MSNLSVINENLQGILDESQPYHVMIHDYVSTIGTCADLMQKELDEIHDWNQTYKKALEIANCEAAKQIVRKVFPDDFDYEPPFHPQIFSREDVKTAIAGNPYADNIMRYIDMLLDTNKVTMRALELACTSILVENFDGDNPMITAHFFNEPLYIACLNQARQEATDEPNETNPD